MGFFKKHFAGKDDHTSDGPPPSYPGDYGHDEQYAPPPGPPPSSSRMKASVDEYQPPPGPPPTKAHYDKSSDDYQPPPGPPPSHDEPPPSYHDWQSAVPDTALLPPPPTIANDFSPSSNASNADARLAWDWCKANPLRSATKPPQNLVARSSAGENELMPPRGFKGQLTPVLSGVWAGSTRAGAGDQCMLTSLPMYFALSNDGPKMSGRARTVYFEVEFRGQGAADREGNLPSLAIGFAAVPYPTWRMPGWERGSIGVHSDDGRRYVNNQDGGQDFVAPFEPGTVVGLGVKYWVDQWGSGQMNSLKGEAFFTRNGQVEERWSLQEEMDQSSEYGIWGVAGDHDLFGAVGTFGEVSFKAVFAPSRWMYQP